MIRRSYRPSSRWLFVELIRPLWERRADVDTSRDGPDALANDALSLGNPHLELHFTTLASLNEFIIVSELC